MMVAAACGRAAHRRKILAWGEEGRGPRRAAATHTQQNLFFYTFGG